MFLQVVFFVSWQYFGQIRTYEPNLPTYDRDFGIWSDPLKKEIIERYYIDKKDAKCKVLPYKGRGGNFNNFRSKGECERHSQLTVEDKIEGCQEAASSEGSCDNTDSNTNRATKFSWVKTTAKCSQFHYTGCGGTRNRYDSEDECKWFCNNEAYGKPDAGLSLDDTEKTYELPNWMDCVIRPNIKSKSPDIGVIADVENKRCLYAAVATKTENNARRVRGTFDNIQSCINKCFREIDIINLNYTNLANNHSTSTTDIDKIKEKIEGCSKETPEQFSKPTPPGKPEIRYYHKLSSKECLPFESWSGAFVNSKNNFGSVELCESYCGAEGNVDTGPKIAPQTCILPKAGEFEKANQQMGNLNVKRWYFGNHGGQQKCISFMFGGLSGNSNNFKSLEECKVICWESLYPEINPKTSEDTHPSEQDDKSPSSE